jgi:hypothetical protein
MNQGDRARMPYSNEEEEGYFFLPEELKGTGEFADRRDFYDDNDRIRVQVDDGKGSVVS